MGSHPYGIETLRHDCGDNDFLRRLAQSSGSAERMPPMADNRRADRTTELRNFRERRIAVNDAMRDDLKLESHHALAGPGTTERHPSSDASSSADADGLGPFARGHDAGSIA
jgi:hypothetical protein